MKALLTGGGFIGRALAKGLMQNGHEVTVFGPEAWDTSICPAVCGDIRDFSGFRRAASDKEVIFHLAGVLGTDYLCERVLEAVAVNLNGAVHVFEVARQTGANVINLGLIPEWDNPYMISKKAAMRMGRMYAHEFGCSITTIEVTHVYGPGQRLQPYEKAIPHFIHSALTERPLKVYGSGRKLMDCIYVSEIAEILRISGERIKDLGDVIQVGSGYQIQVRDLARKVVEMVGSKSEIEFWPMRPGEPIDDTVELPSNRWQSLLNYKPRITIDDGLQETIAWYKANHAY